mgnify:CR=1 FL=1
MNNKNFKKNYEQYLRKKYSLPDNCEILVKQGHITKENETLQMINLTQRGKLLQAQFRTYKLIYDEIKDEILKTYSIIDRAKEDVEILEIQNNSYSINKNLLEIEIESIAKSMVDELAKSIRKITQKTYETTRETLAKEWSEILGTSPEAPVDDLIESELYDKIDSWIKSFKIWLFESINFASYDTYLEEKSFIQKNILDNFFDGIKETFEKVRGKIESITRNAVLNAQTSAQKIEFKKQRVESYEVVLSANPNSCEKCREIAEKSKKRPINIADLKIGETAPPFHPNCGCTMIPADQADKDGSIREYIVIAFNVAFEFLAQLEPAEKLLPPFYNVVKYKIWEMGDFYLGKLRKLPLAQEMYYLGMYGEGKGLSDKAKELLIKRLKESNILKEKIREYTKNGEDFNSGETSVHFTPEEQDLHYSVQRAYLWLEGKKLENGKWEIKVKLRDDYDFTEFRNSLAFTDLANNLGEAMQRNGMMTEFVTEVEFTHIFEGV